MNTYEIIPASEVLPSLLSRDEVILIDTNRLFRKDKEYIYCKYMTKMSIECVNELVNKTDNNIIFIRIKLNEMEETENEN